LGLGDYVMSLQAIEYADPGRENDAELYDIIRPTDQFYHSRINPVCSNPAIIIRNAGSKPLTTAEIRYYVAGGKAEIYTWNGNLQFMETETVTLPISGTDFWNGKQVFTAVITGANNTTDEYALNDTASVHYSIPDNFSTDKIVVAFRTNNSPSHNVLTIQNFNGDTLLLRNNLAANHSYNDTLLLPRGCYTLKLTDAGHDGLSFWANPGQGTGSLQIRSGNSPFPLKTFGADFGAEISYAFSTGFPMEVYDTDKPFSFEVFPNPANGAFYIRLSGYTGNVNLQLTNLIGQQIMTDAVQCSGGISEKKYDLQLTAGIYLLKAGDGNNISTLRLVVRD